jgi:hypothetical protein
MVKKLPVINSMDQCENKCPLFRVLAYIFKLWAIGLYVGSLFYSDKYLLSLPVGWLNGLPITLIESSQARPNRGGKGQKLLVSCI